MQIDAGTATIIAAVITAGGTIIVGVSRWRRRPGSGAAQEIGKKIGDVIAGNYGFRAELAYSRVQVLDSEGNTKTNRGWKGIRLKEGVLLMHIPGKVWVSTPGAHLKTGPTLVRHNDFPKEISLDYKKRTDTECEYHLSIGNLLTPQEPPLDYEIETSYSKAVLMTREAVEKAYENDQFKRDYHSVDVEFPLGRLELEVTFPEGFAVTTYGGVFLAHTETVHDPEYQRVKAGFQRTNRGGRFLIDGPIVGFRYFIYWSLPTRAAS